MNCPKCSRERRVKSGILKGRQRYKCKECGCNYTVELKSAAKPALMKKQALQLYLEGLGFRSVGRFLNVSHVTVYEWIRSFGLQEKMLQLEAKEIETVEIDERHSYANQKTTVGYGLLLTDLGKDSLISLLATEVRKQEKSCGRR
ncbi:Transposase [Bacteroidales bacterium Barb6]|nr:Transposase [Bacteroidales bacterium Barb6]